MTVKNLLLPPPTCAPALLNANSNDKKLYWDRSHYDSPESQMRALALSSTVYVGNLAFSTHSIHLRRYFEQLGPVGDVHVGLDRFRKTPCGFAFVEFLHRIDALSAVVNLTGTKLDGRVIRVELDAGYKPGREFGRGASGGQVRDDRGGGSGRQKGGQNKPQQWGARWQSPGGNHPGPAQHGSTVEEEEGGGETHHYGPAGEGDGEEGNDSNPEVGDKRGREDLEDDQDEDEAPATKNQRLWDEGSDDNM